MLWIVLFAVSMAGVSFLVRRAVEKGDERERERGAPSPSAAKDPRDKAAGGGGAPQGGGAPHA